MHTKLTNRGKTLLFYTSPDLKKAVKKLRALKEAYTITYPENVKAHHEPITNKNYLNKLKNC